MTTATQTADLRPTSSTIRRVLLTAGIEAGLVGTVQSCGHRWIRAAVHRDDSATADEAATAAFPGHVVQGFHGEVRIRVNP